MVLQPSSPLNAGQDGRNVVCGTPTILQNVQAEFSGAIDIRMEHLADKLDSGWLIGILLFEMHDESEGSIFERCICWSDDYGVPAG